MARGQPSNFDSEIKSSIRARPREGSAAEERAESPSKERAEQRAAKGDRPMGSGTPRGAVKTAAMSNPQSTQHLQGGNATAGFAGQSAQPSMAESGQLSAHSHPQTHALPNDPNTPTNDPIIHAAGIAHAILRHGQMSSGGM